MEDAVRQRIKELFFLEKNVTLTSIGSNEAEKMKLSRQVNGSTSISLLTIMLIIEKFPNLSTEWLLRGNGSMFLTDNANNNIETETVTTRHGTPASHIRDTCEADNLLLERIDMLKQKVQDKEEVIATQKETIANLNNHIADLRHTLHYEEQSKSK